MLARAFGEVEFVSIVMMVSRRGAGWLLFLRWRAKCGTLGGRLDGALAR
jgi:hypothetical protein